MDMSRAPGMAAGRAQHPADRTVGRDRVVYRAHGAHQIAALRVGAELAAHVELAQALVLRIVEAARLRLPHIEQRARDRLAVEVQHPAADQSRCSLLVEMGDVAAGRQFGCAEPMERTEY